MKRIVGIFHSEDKAVRAIEGLKTAGYTDDEISIIAKDEEKYNALANRVGTDINNDMNDNSGAAAGAVTGGTIGGLGGLLLGLGALAIPGVGPIVAAGPIAAAVTGALAGGAVGGLAGALVDYGVPEVDAKEYEERINAGDILVLVEDDETRRDKVYDNFYENESANRNTYRHRDRSPIGEGSDLETDRSRSGEVGVAGQRGNTNHMVDSYQKTDLDDPLYKRDNPDTSDPINRDRDRNTGTRVNEPIDRDSSRYPDNSESDPINRDIDRNKSRLSDEPMTRDVNDPINRDRDRNQADADNDPLRRNPQSPAYDGGIATPDRGWNEDINNPEENLENTDHVVESHDQYIDENDPLRPKKPYELDPNLRDVDNSLT